MRIVIVDDEINALHIFLDNAISNHDNSIEYKFFKDDKNEIIDYLNNNYVDGCCLDINMPNINGFELAKIMCEHNPNIKILFITGISCTLNDVPAEIKNNVLGILNKPYSLNDLKIYIDKLFNFAPILTVVTFPTFDCFINDTIVQFPSAKSKELLALLIAYNGKSLTMNDAISQLWPDNNLESSKRLYRDAVWKLRKALKEVNFNCVQFDRALLTLNKQNIKCDYWDFLKNKEGTYEGEFMKNYDWSIDYLSMLDNIKNS